MAVMIKNGKKYYPAARWEHAQHKIEYWLVKAENKIDGWYFGEGELSDKEHDFLEKEVEYLKNLLEHRFYPNEKDGIVYLPYSDYKRVRDMIAKYDARH
jgi:hypothetical protein